MQEGSDIKGPLSLHCNSPSCDLTSNPDAARSSSSNASKGFATLPVDKSGPGHYTYRSVYKLWPPLQTRKRREP